MALELLSSSEKSLGGDTLQGTTEQPKGGTPSNHYLVQDKVDRARSG